MTTSPKDTAATHPPGSPPYPARAAVRPGPGPLTPVADHPGPGAGPRTWTLELPAGLRMLSLNGRLHWSERNRRNAAIRKAAWAMALKAKIPRLRRIVLLAEYQPPDRRARDADNIALSAKAALDGLAAAKVIPSDDSAHVAAVTCRIGPVYPCGRMVLLITEAGEER